MKFAVDTRFRGIITTEETCNIKEAKMEDIEIKLIEMGLNLIAQSAKSCT